MNDAIYNDPDYNSKMGGQVERQQRQMELQEAIEKYKGRYVKYAGAFYKCVDVISLMGCLFCEIYDEPPSQHIDRVQCASIEEIASDDDLEKFFEKICGK